MSAGAKIPVWRQAVIVMEILSLFAITTICLSLLIPLLHLPRSEIVLYLFLKGGFALILAAILSFESGWRACGFNGGLRPCYWPALLPLWIGTAAAIIGGFPAETPLRAIGWVLLGISVAFGEEGVFRGLIIAAILPSGSRRAVIVSAVCFGLSHLAGLIEIEGRIIVMQAIFATGAGLTLGWVRLRSGSIWPCIVAHAALDTSGILAAQGVNKALSKAAHDMTGTLIFALLTLFWGVYLVIWRMPAEPDAQPVATA